MKTLPGKLFNYSTLISFLFLSLISANIHARHYSKCCCNSSWINGLYIGAFGGGGHTSNTDVTQRGLVFFPPTAGGLLVVDASGNSGADAGFWGLQIGYRLFGWPLRFACSNWHLGLNVELEGYYLKGKQTANLINPGTRLDDHDFVDYLPMRTGVFLANVVIPFKNLCKRNVYPYIGFGIGGARVRINNAHSNQVSPVEPFVNHFNSDPSSRKWAFAGQIKAGINFDITRCLRLFAEYRFLDIASTNYTFGATVLPTHAPTTSWRVNFGNMKYHLGDVGIAYSFG